jgi:hypothetical protein
MATIDMTFSSSGAALPGVSAGCCYKLEKTIDFAEVLAEKESALAADDIIKVFDIPIKHAVMAANIHPVVAADATTLTLDLGFTSSPEADPDNFVDGFDATQTSTDGVPVFAAQGYTTAATTLDMELATLTGTLTSGQVKVVAWIVDMS